MTEAQLQARIDAAIQRKDWPCAAAALAELTVIAPHLARPWIELSYVGREGKDAAAEQRRVEVSDAHLARIAATLEESAFRRTRLDRDATFPPDAGRETFFERARLGLADQSGRRGGDSQFEFRGMRELYGIVRGRESILPVELVVQSGLEDFGFGAFPRIRMPRETPDQILYR